VLGNRKRKLIPYGVGERAAKRSKKGFLLTHTFNYTRAYELRARTKKFAIRIIRLFKASKEAKELAAIFSASQKTAKGQR